MVRIFPGEGWLLASQRAASSAPREDRAILREVSHDEMVSGAVEGDLVVADDFARADAVCLNIRMGADGGGFDRRDSASAVPLGASFL